MIGYVFYVDRFAGTLAGVEDHLDYLAELGVRYVHLMPLLQAREGEDDGGYAVTDYRAVDPTLGTMADLEQLCGHLRDRGISVCVDLVLNHTAAEHAWARRARAGDPWAQAMYRIYPDRTMPDRFEATLPEVFPTFAPGNFTPIEGGRWVWTTFHSYQWDLDWSNPEVFLEMTDVLLSLANLGVDVFRLDAVAFMWKRLGTNCQNQPEVHDLLQALRACARIAAPAVIFKAEAIVGPDQLAQYLGLGRHHGRVADMAYHNSLMVQFWSSLAVGDTRLMTYVLREFPHKPVTTAWATYIRCHDDIGWAVTESDAAAVGWDGPAHRAFLSAFYTGESPGSFARGEGFQVNPETGDQRVSGVREPCRPGGGDRGGRSRGDHQGDRTNPARPRADPGLGRDPAPLHGRRDRHAQRPQLPRRARPGCGQPVAPPAPDGLGGRRPAPRPGHGGGTHLRGASRSSRRAGARHSCRPRRPSESSTAWARACSGSSASTPSAG